MKNNKGFTLIELLAVIVLLGVVMLIATGSIMSVKNKINKAALLEKLELIMPSAEEYAEKIDLYSDTTKTTTINGYTVKYEKVSIQTLIDNGYLETGETSVTNPIDDSNINGLEIIVYLLRDRTFACIPDKSFNSEFSGNDALLTANNTYSISDLNLDSILCKN